MKKNQQQRRRKQNRPPLSQTVYKATGGQGLIGGIALGLAILGAFTSAINNDPEKEPFALPSDADELELNPDTGNYEPKKKNA